MGWPRFLRFQLLLLVAGVFLVFEDLDAIEFVLGDYLSC